MSVMSSVVLRMILGEYQSQIIQVPNGKPGNVLGARWLRNPGEGPGTVFIKGYFSQDMTFRKVFSRINLWD